MTTEGTYLHNLHKFYSAEDVRKAADSAGSYYFSDGAMKFFNSRLLSGFWPLNSDRTSGYIIVSNQDMGGLLYDPLPRVYNVVRVTQYHKESGHVKLDFDTVESCDSRLEAVKLIKELTNA